MSIRVRVSTHGTSTVISLEGDVDAELLAHLGDGISAVAREAVGEVLVDVDALTLIDGATYGPFVDKLIGHAGDRAGVIASRPDTQQVLVRDGVDTRLSIHDSRPEGDL